jgi:uncharacterized delta-60 repeat protein
MRTSKFISFFSLTTLGLLTAGCIDEPSDEDLAENVAALLDVQLDKDGIWVSSSAQGEAREGRAVAIDSQSRAIVGSTLVQNGTPKFSLSRFTALGKLDLTFANGHAISPMQGTVNAVAVDPTGRVLAAGTDAASGAGTRMLIARYTAAGALDTTFSGDGRTYIDVNGTLDEAFSIAPWRGGYLVGGRSKSAAGKWQFSLARIKADGTLDATFSADGIHSQQLGTESAIHNVFVVPGVDAANDTVIASGSVTTAAGLKGVALAAYATTGAAHPTWNAGQPRIYTAPNTALTPEAAAISKDGRRVYVVGGGVRDVAASAAPIVFAMKFSDGAPVTPFGGAGSTIGWHNFPSGTNDRATGVALDRKERLVISGTSTGPGTWGWLVRLLGTGASAGLRDSTYFAGGFDRIDAPDGGNESLADVATTSGGYTVAVGGLPDTSLQREAMVIRTIDEPTAAAFTPTGTGAAPWVNGYLLSRVSAAVYNEDGDEDTQVLGPQAKALLSRTGWKVRKYMSLGVGGIELETDALVVENSKVVVVAFKGTELGDNLHVDIDGLMDPYEGAQVHEGFLKAMRDTLPGVRAAVQASLAEVPERKVWLAGHSLGGAVATLMAYELDVTGIDVAGVMTIGAPRVGDAAFAGIYNTRLREVTHRFVNYQDPIPDAAPRSRGYVHVGRQHWINWNPSHAGGTWGVVFDDLVERNYEFYADIGLAPHAKVLYANNLLYMMPANLRP